MDRFVRRLLWLLASALFRVRVDGLENLPRDAAGRVRGGWICAAAPHRNWVEPVVLLGLLPAVVRVVTVADGRTVTGSWWRRLAARLVGGAIAVGGGRGGAAELRGHVASAVRVVTGGGVLAIFPETGSPTRPPRLRRISRGVAWFAAASGAVVVPVVLGGTDELYLGRRIVVRILPPVAPPPSADGPAVAAWMADFGAIVAPAAGAAHTSANRDVPRRKPWRWLTGRFPRA